MSVKIVFIADTHGMHERIIVPDGDILVHAGDITNSGKLMEAVAFDRWIAKLPHEHKIVIAGNHDFCFQTEPREAQASLRSCTYLEDEGYIAKNLSFYGSPWQPWFYDWAFNLPRGGDELRAKWASIPDDTDILVTHGPPAGYGDLTANGDRAGCAELLDRVRQVVPRVHCFGHIHEGYGTTREDRTIFVNASVCNLRYEPVNPPLVIAIPD